LVLKIVRPRAGTPVYGLDLYPALLKCWAVLRAPAGKLLAPMLPGRICCRGDARIPTGTLLKSQISVRNWAKWYDAVPGFVEIDLVGHDGSNGKFCFTLTVTDIATGWTLNRSGPNKAAKWVSKPSNTSRLPFHIIGIDSDNGSEFKHLLAYCQARQITFTRSRPAKKHDGA
jgi:hypothetical protein